MIGILARIAFVLAVLAFFYRVIFFFLDKGYGHLLCVVLVFAGMMFCLVMAIGKSVVYPRFLLLISSIGLIVATFYFPAIPESVYKKGDSVSEEMWCFPWGKIRAVPLVYRVEEKTASGLNVNLVFHPTKEQALEYDPNDVKRFLHQFLVNRIAEMIDYSDAEIQSLKEKLLILPENLVGEVSGTVTVTTFF